MRAATRATALLALALSTSAGAATFTVTTTGDSGPGSLREAVAQANAAPGAHTIDFAVTGTIALAVDPIQQTTSPIQITKGPLTIAGPGADKLAIDGSASGRIFTIFPVSPVCPALSAPADYLVTLSGLTLRNGRNKGDGSGGALLSFHSLVLDSVVVRDNVAPRGGGVAFVTQYPGQSLTIANSQFLDNAARPTDSGTSSPDSGGALRVVENCAGTRPVTTISISNSLFSGNRSEPTAQSGSGGAIGIFAFGPVTISDTRIVDNHVVRPSTPVAGRSYLGGGIYGHAPSFTIERSEIAENSADNGGGIQLFNNFADRQAAESAYSFRLIDSTVSGNAAITTGGGVRLVGNVATEIFNSTIVSNVAQTQLTNGINITTGATDPASGANARQPTLKLVSSIVANQTVSAADIGISLTVIASPYAVDASNSLIQSPGLGVQVIGSGNLTGFSPYLGPLAFNGGATRTHAPLPASLVIDRGANPLGLATDQRGSGFSRVRNTVPDMGAYEGASTFLPTAGFAPVVKYDAGNPTLRSSSDLSGDALADLVSVDGIANAVDVLTNNGDGTFARRTYPVGAGPVTSAACDLDGDGLRDLVVVNKDGNSLSRLINQGDDSFAPLAPIVTGSQPTAITCLSGLTTPLRHHLHIVNGGDHTFTHFVDDGAGAFTLAASVPVGTDPRWVLTTDFDFDTRWDSVAISYAAGSVTVLKQNPGFAYVATEYPVQGGPVHGSLADLNGDGLLDIVVVNSTGNSVSILRNLGAATFAPAVHYPVGANPQGTLTGDFNGDGRPDIAVRNAGSGDLAVLINNGDATFKPAAFYPVGGQPSTINSADFDGDAVPDLVLGVGTTNSVAVLYGRGDGTFRPARIAPVGAGPTSAVQTADLNGDGRPDIAVALAGESKVAVLLNTTQQAILGATTKANHQGLWWKLPAGSESGWGINLAHQGDTLFLTWFTYGEDGKPLWLAAVLQKLSTGVYAGDAFTTTGSPYDVVPFDSSKVVETVVGTVTLTFFLSGNAYFAYTVHGVSQSKYITRQLFAEPVPTCVWGAQDNLAFATNYQDLWWGFPAGSESGWGINLTQQGDLIVATWFTYGTDGKPMWYIAVAEKTGAKSFAGPISSVTGPPFYAVPFDPANVVETVVGNVTFTFVDGNRGTFAYTVNGVSQVKEITRQVFEPPGTVCF